jgi:teichuronic acid biosynthesis glycosyltransferase TuaC
MSRRPTRILTFSSLFPNPTQPLHGLFVAERLRHLLATGEVDAEIVAPVPWFPSGHPIFGRYAQFARVPKESIWLGRRVLHPRYVVVPGPGWYASPLTMAAGTRAAVEQLRGEGRRLDLIDAHYLYPDGVAAALLGGSLDLPVVITARGSDVTFIPRHPLARRWILWAARRSAALVAVSGALKDRMVAMGIDAAKIEVLRNGVDFDRFHPIDREAARLRLRVNGRVMLSVGHLIELKGPHLVIEALAGLPDWTLLIVGEGPLRSELSKLARSLGCAARVRFEGAVPQNELLHYYNAADLLVLASSREGMANVLLEAAACGTPIVATRVEGSAEVVEEPHMGRLLPERSAGAIVAAVRELDGQSFDRKLGRTLAHRLGWAATVEGLLGLYGRVAKGS